MAQTKQNHKKNSGRPSGSSTRFPGIVAAAQAIGRSPNHLRLVLLGERKSATLISALIASGHPLGKHFTKA